MDIYWYNMCHMTELVIVFKYLNFHSPHYNMNHCFRIYPCQRASLKSSILKGQKFLLGVDEGQNAEKKDVFKCTWRSVDVL